MRQLRKQQFIKKGRLTHNDKYDYSKVTYVNVATRVCIICPEHGEFWQTPDKHVRGGGCPKCGVLKRAESRKNHHKSKRPDLSHIETPPGSKAVPVGTNGDYALVDEEDYERVMEHNWNVSNYGYAVSNTAGFMHRLILNVTDPKRHVHHKDHNRLNNTKSNIIECSHKDNLSHQSPQRIKKSSVYKGVSWNKGCKKWHSYIKHNGLRINLGLFDSEIEAAKAYDEAAKKHFKDFARLNFPG